MTSALPAIGPILLGTVAVPDLAVATAAYTDTFGWVVQAEGTVDAALAAAWQAPRAEGSHWRTVGSSPTREGGVRLVERPGSYPAQSPLLVPGWRSLEICVEDVHATRARLDGSPFTVLGEPHPLSEGSPIWAMQAIGPGREMLYLTNTVPDSGFDIPLAQAPVDKMFIAVMSAPTLEGAAAWYKAYFATGLELPPEPYTLTACCADAGTDPAERHRITALGLGGQTLIEIDDHFPGHEHRTAPAGDLRPGIAHITWQVSSLDPLAGILLAPPVTRAEAPYGGRRVAVAAGAAGELLELVEG